MSLAALPGWLEERRPAMIAVLRTLVEHETPSADKPRADALARLLAARFAALGARVTAQPREHYGDHLVVEWPATPPTDATPALLLCHYDTVHPVGHLARYPFEERDGLLSGPGVFDMKASIVMTKYAVRAMTALGLAPPRPVRILLTSDEEVGSPSSRALIEAEARAAAYVLVLESPLAKGAVKTARKGVGRFLVRVQGKAAHAGLEPQNGVNAIVELAHQIPRLDALADPSQGTTLNVGLIRGGTSRNTVPAHAEADVDARVWSMDEAERVTAAFQALRPHHPRAQIEVAGGFHRPPMERTPAVAALFERVRAIARDLGQHLDEGKTGGASDANLTAALGVPTLDGLGALGASAHAEHEYVEAASLAPRAALLAALLLEL